MNSRAKALEPSISAAPRGWGRRSAARAARTRRRCPAPSAAPGPTTVRSALDRLGEVGDLDDVRGVDGDAVGELGDARVAGRAVDARSPAGSGGSSTPGRARARRCRRPASSSARKVTRRPVRCQQRAAARRVRPFTGNRASLCGPMNDAPARAGAGRRAALGALVPALVRRGRAVAPGGPRGRAACSLLAGLCSPRSALWLRGRWRRYAARRSGRGGQVARARAGARLLLPAADRLVGRRRGRHRRRRPRPGSSRCTCWTAASTSCSCRRSRTAAA